jgi:hypothetical protein
MDYGTSEEVKGRAARSRNRKLRDKNVVREKPIGPIKGKTKAPYLVMLDDDEIVDLRSIRSLRDLPAE